MKLSKSTTKDERFLLKLFEIASRFGDPTREVDRYEVGQTIGQRERGVDTTVRTLAQSNFVKKGSGSTVYLSTGGLELIKRLRDGC